MENILILTYYYPPSISVATFRPLSWSKDFHKYGFNTTIITRHWNADEKKWDDFLKENLNDVKIVADKHTRTIYLPYKRNKYVKIAEKRWIQRLGISKFIYFFLSILGNFQKEIDADGCFKDYVYKHLESEKYKLVIVTSPPLNLISLAFQLNKKFGIPFVVDFQDSWNNYMLADNYHPSFNEKFQNSLKQFYLKKWLKNSLFISAVTPAFTSFIKKISDKPIEIITNGFEKNAYNLNVVPSSKFLNISVMGTILPIQDISIMIDGLNLFLSDKDPQYVIINFIGLDSLTEMSEKIKKSLPIKFIYTSSRVSMEESIKLTLAAHILLFPSYKGYKDYYTAKIFEYLGSGRNILMVPGNYDKVDELIETTQSGKIANTVEEFIAILNTWYIEWKETGALKYHGIEENVNFFSRENQNKLFIQAIKKHLKSTRRA